MQLCAVAILISCAVTIAHVFGKARKQAKQLNIDLSQRKMQATNQNTAKDGK